jgi:hypothetical protein
VATGSGFGTGVGPGSGKSGRGFTGFKGVFLAAVRFFSVGFEGFAFGILIPPRNHSAELFKLSAWPG